MDSNQHGGLLLMNLGSPDSTKVKDVRSYLHEFLMDKRVMDYPYLFRKLLVDGLIIPFRASKSAAAYQTIWWDEGSPLVVLTRRLQEILRHQLQLHVGVGMRYGHPSTEGGMDALLSADPSLEEVILFPLYPHYAMSSYETAVELAMDIWRRRKFRFRVRTVSPFYNHPSYISALCDSIRPYLDQDFDELLFSYHGLPERHIRKSDPTGSHCLAAPNCCDQASPAHARCYRHQVITTTHLAAAELGISPEKYGISFQSRLGRDPWLEPSTVRRLAELPAEGKKNLLVVCPSFVSDCLETLEEIAEEGKHIFMAAGGQRFQLIPCMNTHPSWIKAIPEILKSNTGPAEMPVR
jgi:ferrochelatase